MARCPEPCGKHRYGEEHTAQLACIQAAMQGRHLTWYRSPPCRCWHLTSKQGRGIGGRRGHWVQTFAADPPAA
jgi:hypothetical protein